MEAEDKQGGWMRILMTGDLHMNSLYYRKYLAYVREQDPEVSTVISLGDFGFTYPGYFLREVEEALVEYGFDGYFLRGNHDSTDVLGDDPYGSLLEDTDEHETDMEMLTDHLGYLRDGRVYTFGGVRFGVLGGATSWDRLLREPYVSWWPDERPDPRAVMALSLSEFDVMLTHDVPAGTIPWVETYSPPEFLKVDICYDRTHIREVVGCVGPQYLFHGHLHKRYQGYLPGYGKGGRVTAVHGLGCDDGPFSDFGVIFDTLSVQNEQ